METMHRLLEGNILSFLRHYRGEPFHAVLCDPPYELGFMSKRWDSTGITYAPALWRGLKRVLQPGGFVFAFGGARTYHRMAVAAEDAGFIIHPLIAWTFGNGFPKATRIDLALDRLNGQQPQQGAPLPAPTNNSRRAAFHNGLQDAPHEQIATSEVGQMWAGHRYGLQALRPALEPILVAQKPYRGKAVLSILQTGAGAFNIAASRILTDEKTTWSGTDIGSAVTYRTRLKPREPQEHRKTGRWASNFIVCHSPNCTDDHCAEDCPVRAIGEQSVYSKSSRKTRKNNGTFSVAMGRKHAGTGGYDDSGTAARYFWQADHSAEEQERADGVPFFYAGKARLAEREAGVQTGIHHPDTDRLNLHPTVKPIRLTQHLASLLLPPSAYAPRRLLVPFAGSGSEMIGALLAGWECVVGVEREADYVQIAKERLAYWAARARQDKGALGVKRPPPVSAKQLQLFED